MILAGDIGIEAPVVLLEIAARRVADGVLRNIGDVREPTAYSRVTVDIGEILRAQSGGQRRTNVQALSSNRIAIYALNETGSRAGGRADHRTRTVAPLKCR